MNFFDATKLNKKLVSRSIINTRLNETDPYGVINNSEYYNYFEIARFDLIRSSYVSLTDFMRVFRLSSHKCKFICPLTFGNTIVVTTKVKAFDYQKGTWEFEQTINMKLTNKFVAKSSSIYLANK